MFRQHDTDNKSNVSKSIKVGALTPLQNSQRVKSLELLESETLMKAKQIQFPFQAQIFLVHYILSQKINV